MSCDHCADLSGSDFAWFLFLIVLYTIILFTILAFPSMFRCYITGFKYAEILELVIIIVLFAIGLYVAYRLSEFTDKYYCHNIGSGVFFILLFFILFLIFFVI